MSRKNKRNKPRGDQQIDLFAPRIVDMRLRDQRETMEHAFLSLSKRPRMTPIEYRNAGGSVWVRVSPHQDHGMANIYDWDVIIWAASQIRAAMKRGEESPRTIYFTPYNLLKSIRRDPHSGNNYDRLRDTFDRLQSTTVKTNIRQEGQRRIDTFSWLDHWTELADEEGKADGWQLTLCQWLWEGIVDEKLILSVHPDYFLLTSGTERWLYRVARKHAGRQRNGFGLRMHRLHAKSGSTRARRKFAYKMRKIVERDQLPEYALDLYRDDEDEEFVHMTRRCELPTDDERYESPTSIELQHRTG